MLGVPSLARKLTRKLRKALSPYDAKTKRRSIRCSLYCFYISCFLWKFGYGIFYTTRVELQASAFGGYAKSASTLAWFDGSNCLIDFFFSPIWGVVGDKIGRKPLIVLYAIVKAFPICLVAVGAPLWLFFTVDDINPLPGAISGGVCGAYIADLLVADHEHENDEGKEGESAQSALNPATAFAYYQASLFFGEAVGTLMGPTVHDLDTWASWGLSGTRGVIMTASAFYVLNVLWCMVALEESLQDHHQDNDSDDETHPETKKSALQTLKESLKKGTPAGAIRLILSLGPCLVAYSILFSVLCAVSQGLDEVKDQYVAVRMGITHGALSHLHVFMALMIVLGNLVLTPMLTNNLGLRRASYIGIALSVIGIIVLAAGDTSQKAYVAFTLFSWGQVWNPAIQGSIARATPGSKQGAMQAALASILALGMALSPIPFAYVFTYTSDTSGESPLPYCPAAVCLLAAAIMIIVSGATYRSVMWSDKKNRYHTIFSRPKHHLAEKAAKAAAEKAAKAREPLIESQYVSLE